MFANGLRGSYISMCDKKTFPNRTKAHFALRLITNQGKRLRAYECDRCYKYHLTSDMDAKTRHLLAETNGYFKDQED